MRNSLRWFIFSVYLFLNRVSRIFQLGVQAVESIQLRRLFFQKTNKTLSNSTISCEVILHKENLKNKCVMIKRAVFLNLLHQTWGKWFVDLFFCNDLVSPLFFKFDIIILSNWTMNLLKWHKQMSKDAKDSTIQGTPAEMSVSYRCDV